jgi:HD-like signal output (HDOD) protein
LNESALRSHPQLPGLAANIGRIVTIADSKNEFIQELRDVILADVHLTQRILAIANSVGYPAPLGTLCYNKRPGVLQTALLRLRFLVR